MEMCLGLRNALRTVRLTAVFRFALAGGTLYSALLAAGDVVELAISDKQGVYQVTLEIILDAPFEDVHYVVTDYLHIYRTNPSIVESEILPTLDASVTRVRTVINDCVLFFCQEVLRVEDVRELGTGDIYAVIVPRLSNVKSGSALWQIRSLGAKTRINYHLKVEPGFSVPPLIGSHIVKQKLREQILTSFDNIERIARIRGEREKARDSTLKETVPKDAPGEHDDAK
jgi:hypothetical protein